MREMGERRMNLQSVDTFDIKLADGIWHPLRTVASNKQVNSYLVVKGFRDCEYSNRCWIEDARDE
jgi:hypothetical protein